MNVSRTFKRIKITAKTVIAKPGNGQMARGNMKNLLLVYNGQGGAKDGKRYLVKGLRGVLNHAIMALAKQRGIEVCHSSDKKETQTGDNLLPEGYRSVLLLSACRTYPAAVAAECCPKGLAEAINTT